VPQLPPGGPWPDGAATTGAVLHRSGSDKRVLSQRTHGQGHREADSFPFNRAERSRRRAGRRRGPRGKKKRASENGPAWQRWGSQGSCAETTADYYQILKIRKTSNRLFSRGSRTARAVLIPPSVCQNDPEPGRGPTCRSRGIVGWQDRWRSSSHSSSRRPLSSPMRPTSCFISFDDRNDRPRPGRPPAGATRRWSQSPPAASSSSTPTASPACQSSRTEPLHQQPPKHHGSTRSLLVPRAAARADRHACRSEFERKGYTTLATGRN